MKTRLAVAVLLPRFPPADDPAIVREIEELERQGQPVLVLPLLLRPATGAVLAANMRALVQTPGRCARLLARLAMGLAGSPTGLLRALALLPRCVYLAERLKKEGVGHLHACSTPHPAMAADVISSLTGIGYSVAPSPHASELLALLDRVSERAPPELSRWLEAFAWNGHAPPALGVRRVHEREDSTVIEVLVAERPRGRDAVFKAQRAHPAGQRARTEFEVLSRLSTAFAGHPGYGVPLPLGLDEAVAAVVMEPCRGQPLDALVREARTSRAAAPRLALESALRRTGGWLRFFQAQTARPAEGRSALEALCARARRDLDTCAGRALARPRAARLAERLDGLAARVAAPAFRVVGRQGDFWPGNVHVTEDRVEVIDFEGFGEGLPYEDAAYFFLQLELFYAYPGLRRQFPALGRAFLEGYLEAGALDHPAWELCRLAKGLHMLAQDITRGRGRGPRRWWRRHVLRAQVHEQGS